jgi:hypothetical protein
MSVKSNLEAAYAIYKSYPTTRAYARTGAGLECNPLDPTAKRFCSVGALMKKMGWTGGLVDSFSPEYQALREAASRVSRHATIGTVNDHCSDDVIDRMWLLAIDSADGI